MVLVFAENTNGKFKKNALEAVTYAKKTADALGTQCAVLVLGSSAEAETLGNYGADSVHVCSHDGLNNFDSQIFSAAIAEAANQLGAKVVILSDTLNGKAIAGRVAVKLGATCLTGAISIPSVDGSNLQVKKNIYSGKAIANFQLGGERKVISVMGNALPPEQLGTGVAPVEIALNIAQSKVNVEKVERIEGTVPLPEAELVVSAGRGMKGPENWGIIEELARELGATTACSRPVADTGWRPHHEHVGQTGVAIRPNLYFAIGISGAIQHLAGVNKSKVIVVINKDPEAPFFKAADYGICADLFDVVPRLTEAVKKFKAANA